MSIRFPSHLYRSRHCVFYFRLLIPLHLQKATQRSEIRFSLNTEVKESAALLALSFIHRIPNLWASLQYMTDNKKPIPEDYFKLWRDALFKSALLKGKISLLQGEVKELTEEMAESVSKVKAKRVAINAHRLGQLTGKSSMEEILRFPWAPEKTPLFSELIDAYMRSFSHRPKGGIKKPPSEKTLESYQKDIGIFMIVMGDHHIGEIDRDIAGEYFNILRRLPANITRIAAYRDKTIPQLLELKAPPQSESNVSKKMERLSTMFQWAIEEKRTWGIDTNPFKGFGQSGSSGEHTRRPFTNEEIKTLLEHPSFTKRVFNSSYSYWAIPLALFTGARLGELAQLDLKDFVRIDEIDCIDINDIAADNPSETATSPKKSIKTINAKRLVPLHPELIRLGILRHVNKLREQGQTHLFPELNRNRRDGRGQAVSNWFQRFRARVGITNKHELVFHSFRHLFITKILDAGVSPHMLAPIVGHEAELITGKVYWNKNDAKIRKSTVDLFALQTDLLKLIPTVEEVKFKLS